MGSLRIGNAPTLGDLGVRLAKRKSRDAITGHTIVQAYNSLKYFAGNEIEKLFPDLDEIYLDETSRLGLKPEKISSRIIEVDEIFKSDSVGDDNLALASWKGNDELLGNQQFEFNSIEGKPNLNYIKEFIRKLNVERLNIANVPLLRCISVHALEQIFKRLNMSSGEVDKVRAYTEKCEQIIRENSCHITAENKSVLGNDLKEVDRLMRQRLINVVVNGESDFQNAKDEMETAFMNIFSPGKTDFLRIESDPFGEDISISYYSCIFPE